MDGGAPSTQRSAAGRRQGSTAYFSLDFYVDTIEDMTVGCRVPSIQFTFLDFPPITVYSPTVTAVRGHEERQTSRFNQGKSCVFESVESELRERMRKESLRLAWLDSWQMKDKVLGSCAVSLSSGMNRRVNGHDTHVQSGNHRLYDERGQDVCTVSIRFSILRHGRDIAPEMLQHRDYRTAPVAEGMRNDWEPVIKRIVKEYYASRGDKGEAQPTLSRLGTREKVETDAAVLRCERKIQQSEETMVERLESISRRIAQVQRTNLELVGTVSKLEESNQGPRAQDKLRMCELEQRNNILQDKLIEMSKLQRASTAGLSPAQILQAIKFQVAELLKRNPSFDLQRVFDAFDLDGDGVVSADEFVSGLREIGLSLEPAQIPAVLELLPMDNDQIIYKTFVWLFGGKEQYVLTDVTKQVRRHLAQRGIQLRAAFQAMDTNHDGAISRDEFAEGLRALQIDLHLDKLDELVRLIDADADGLINYYDFMSHFSQFETGWDWTVTASVNGDQHKTSLEWAVLRGGNDPVVLSPDGWDRTDLRTSLLEPISLATYLRRINQSTTAELPNNNSRTDVPLNNSVWMREALNSKHCANKRTAPTSRLPNNSSVGGCILEDGYFCPPALSFVSTSGSKAEASSSRQTTVMKRGSNSRTAFRRPNGVKQRQTNMNPYAQKRLGQIPTTATVQRSAVLDAVTDEHSFRNAAGHAEQLLPRSKTKQTLGAEDSEAGYKISARTLRQLQRDIGRYEIRADKNKKTTLKSRPDKYQHSSAPSVCPTRHFPVNLNEDLRRFISGLGLGKYMSMCIKSLEAIGADSLEDLKLLSERDLLQVGLPLLPARRILNATKGSIPMSVDNIEHRTTVEDSMPKQEQAAKDLVQSVSLAATTGQEIKLEQAVKCEQLQEQQEAAAPVAKAKFAIIQQEERKEGERAAVAVVRNKLDTERESVAATTSEVGKAEAEATRVKKEQAAVNRSETTRLESERSSSLSSSLSAAAAATAVAGEAEAEATRVKKERAAVNRSETTRLVSERASSSSSSAAASTAVAGEDEAEATRGEAQGDTTAEAEGPAVQRVKAVEQLPIEEAQDCQIRAQAMKGDIAKAETTCATTEKVTPGTQAEETNVKNASAQIEDSAHNSQNASLDESGVYTMDEFNNSISIDEEGSIGEEIVVES